MSLPANWERHESKSHPGAFYYFNTVTGESTWDEPKGELVQVRVLHILKKHNGSRRPASWRNPSITCSKEEATRELSLIRQQILNSPNVQETFKRIAETESDCNSAKRGGDLGFFKRGQMQKPFEDCSFRLNIGEVSDIVETDSGVHIILRVAYVSKFLPYLRSFSVALLRKPRSKGYPVIENYAYLATRIQSRFIDIRKELKEVHCCCGCGVQLQFKEESEYGYIPKDALVSSLESGRKPICQRCHRLRFSGTVNGDQIPASVPKEIIGRIPFKKHSLILFVCDAMDLPGSIVPHLNELVHEKPMVVVVNKMDLLPVDSPSPQMKRWVHSLFKAHRITNIKDVFFVSSLNNSGIGSVLNYINHTPFKHVYLIGMTNSGKSSFLNQCIRFTKSKVTVMNLLSLSDEGITLNKEGMIADDHFDVDYWDTNTFTNEIEPTEPIFTISSLPSTTLGVLAVKLHGARFLMYDTPGICPSAYRVRLLTTMLMEEQKKGQMLFPRKALVPTVFSLHPEHTVLLGALGQIDYVAVDNTNPLIGYSYSPLPLHVCKTVNVPRLLEKHAGSLFMPPFSENQYLTSGGIVPQNEFPLNKVFNTPSEVKNTLMPNSPSSLKYTAFLDVSVGGFGWIAFFAQGGDNTNKKYKQLQAGTLRFSAVKGFDLYPRPPLLTSIPEKRRKYK